MKIKSNNLDNNLNTYFQCNKQKKDKCYVQLKKFVLMNG